jgi:hypothetical protein
MKRRSSTRSEDAMSDSRYIRGEAVDAMSINATEIGKNQALGDYEGIRRRDTMSY